jgi:hypothetical protein
MSTSLTVNRVDLVKAREFRLLAGREKQPKHAGRRGRQLSVDRATRRRDPCCRRSASRSRFAASST